MEIRLNGKPRTLPVGVTTVGGLLAELDVKDTIVMVERNGHILNREEHRITPLEEGDRLEVIRFVGGG